MTDENNIQATVFTPQGSTLELRRVARVKANGDEVFGFGGFDTTGRRLNLRLPEGYTPAENPYVLFQWLDDDRFAVMPGATHENGHGFSGYGDILVCDIAREECTLAVPGPAGVSTSDEWGDGFRLVPHRDPPN